MNITIASSEYGPSSGAMKLESFGVCLNTAGGNQLAAGGLCRPGSAPRWRSAFLGLADLTFNSQEPGEIDRTLADGILAMSDAELIAAGASVRIPAYAGLLYGSTGGVLGMIGEKPLASDGSFGEAAPGMWLHTMPGSSGFLIQANAEIALAVFAQWQGTWCDEKNGRQLKRIIDSFEISCYLIVSDGTGVDASGFFAAADATAGCSWSLTEANTA